MKDTPDSSTHKSPRPRQVPGGPYIVPFIHTLAELGLLPGIRRAKKYLGPVSLGEIGDISDFCRKYSYKKVLLVGSNPSSKSPDETPFHPETKSRQFVDKWFEGEGWTVAYENLVDFKTENNKQLSTMEIEANIPWIVENMVSYRDYHGYKIVACGKIAAKGLTLAGIEHFEMPHPSGLCRFWNDKEASEAKIKEMKEWLLK